MNGKENATLNGQFKPGLNGLQGVAFYSYNSERRDTVIFKTKDDMDSIFGSYLESYLEQHPVSFEIEDFIAYYSLIYDDILNLISNEVLITEAQVLELSDLSKKAMRSLSVYPARLIEFRKYSDIANEFKESPQLRSYSMSVMNILAGWQFMASGIQREIQMIIFPYGLNLNAKTFEFSPRNS